MRVVTPTDLRKRLGEILDAASAGERIRIERDHRPLAVLVPIEDAERLDGDRGDRIKRRLEALDRLAEFRDRLAKEYPPIEDGMTEVEWLHRERERRADRVERAGRGSEDQR